MISTLVDPMVFLYGHAIYSEETNGYDIYLLVVIFYSLLMT